MNKNAILKNNKNFIKELKSKEYLATISGQTSYYLTPTIGTPLIETCSIDSVYSNFIYYD